LEGESARNSPKVTRNTCSRLAWYGSLDVLEHQLPVGRDELTRIAEDLDLPAVEDAVDELDHRLAEVGLERFDFRGERREDDAVARGDLEPAQAVLRWVEVGGHPALLLHAAAERHADEVPLEIVGPLVVRAHELLRMPEVLLAELHAAVRAAVLDDVDAALGVAHLPLPACRR
jgi:hypothetical protein